jgi:putative endonuclease
MSKNWYVYLVRCKDNSLYCGTTNNVERRVHAHTMQTGAKYTASRAPVTLVYTELCGTQSLACIREYEIKHMTKEQKENLVADYSEDVRKTIN